MDKYLIACDNSDPNGPTLWWNDTYGWGSRDAATDYDMPCRVGVVRRDGLPFGDNVRWESE